MLLVMMSGPLSLFACYGRGVGWIEEFDDGVWAATLNFFAPLANQMTLQWKTKRYLEEASLLILASSPVNL